MNQSMLARLRGQAMRFLNDTCDIWRPSRTLDQWGTPKQELSNVGTGIACRIITAGSQMSGAVVTRNLQALAENEIRCALPNGTDIRAGDRIEIRGTRPQGIMYEVVRLETELTDEFFEMAVIYEA